MAFFTKVPETRYTDGGITGLTKQGWITVAVILAVGWFFLFCFRTVDATQVGVITRYGAVNREVSPGVAVKLPWPIERLHKFNVKVAKEEVTTQASTKDSQIINSKVAVNYHIERGKAADVYSKLGDKYLETVLLPRVQTLFKNNTPAYTGPELPSNRGNIEKATLKAIQSEFGKQGIQVEQFSIVDFGFSPAIAAAIEAKQVAQQSAEKAVYDTQRVAQEAAASIEQAKGQAESQRLLNSTASDKTIELKNLEVQQSAINKWNGAMPSTVLSSNGSGTIFNIPLQGSN